MATGTREKGFHSWEVGNRGEELAKRILHKMGFEVIKSEGTIDGHPLTIRAEHLLRSGKHGIAGLFAFDLYAERGKEKWFIEVKTTEQKREHGIHLTKRQCRFGLALQTLGYNIGVLRIRLIEKERKKIVKAKIHKIPAVFFLGLKQNRELLELFSKYSTIDYYPKNLHDRSSP